MAMLDGLKRVFLRALLFVPTDSMEMLVDEWNAACEEVYEYKESLKREMHTADVVEVIRCKDCVYGEDSGGTICRCGVGRSTKPDGFCHKGERSEK